MKRTNHHQEKKFYWSIFLLAVLHISVFAFAHQIDTASAFYIKENSSVQLAAQGCRFDIQQLVIAFAVYIDKFLAQQVILKEEFQEKRPPREERTDPYKLFRFILFSPPKVESTGAQTYF